MNSETLANRLYAASVAVRHGGARENRETLIELCALVQAGLVPPAEDLTWRSHVSR